MPRSRIRLTLSALRPRPDRKLPEEFRLDRVGRLARQVVGDVRHPAFADLLADIDGGASIHRNNQVELYFDGDEAFEAMQDAIDGAEREVLLESYIIRDDEIGRRILGSLREASHRGVEVRVLADAYGSSEADEGFWGALRDDGIQVRLFQPLWPNPLNSGYRDHRKILAVDRRVAFTGGMNIANKYRGSRGMVEHPWRDTHAKVEGSAAGEMALVFLEGWLRTGGDELDVEDRSVAGPGGEEDVLVLEARPHRGHAEAASVLAAIAGLARERLWITNAYFAPRRTAVRVLREPALRGVDVRLLLPAWTDVPLVRHAGHGWFSELLAWGVRIFEYQPALLHAKSLVADGYASVVGSTNLDFRSFHFNAECNLVILGEATGRRLEEVFEEDLAQAEEIHAGPWQKRPIPHRVGDRVCRWLAPLF